MVSTLVDHHSIILVQLLVISSLKNVSWSKYCDIYRIVSYNLPLMKNFRCRFSGTMKAVKLKLGIHMDNGLMYRVYQNQGKGSITLGVTVLDRFYNFPWMKHFRYRLLKNYESYTIETWCTHGQWAEVSCIPESEPRAYNCQSYIP